MREMVGAGLVVGALLSAAIATSLITTEEAGSAAREVIGNSVESTPVQAVQLGDPASDRVALVVGIIHGNEKAGLQVTRVLRKRYGGLEGAQIWVVDTVNPDGQSANSRKNARAVDLNRNFPYRWRADPPPANIFYPGPAPASEPETQAVMAFIERIQPDVSIWYHQELNAVLACPGPKSAARYAKLTDMRTSCKWRRLHGTAISWEEHVMPGSSSFVVELHGGRLSPREARRHAFAAATIARGD